jgi:aryl-alcohol dehydrogenase-like predicted oxidoreductase
MKYRTLGKSGLKVSELGMGTWQLANDPHMWVGSDFNESTKSLHKYVELGGNFIDTAWIYGYDSASPNEHPSENMIGKFLKESGLRDKVIIASKIPGKNMHWPAWKGIPISEVFPNDWIEKCVDDSLRSLGVETIDLMQFHVWQDDFADENGWKETVGKITKSGKVKNWGISINDYQPTNCLKTLDTGLISTIQFIFNIFHQKPTEKLFPYAKEHDIGLIARVPLDEGGLGGNISPETKFEEGDFRRSYFTEARLKELSERTKKLMQVSKDEVKTLPELALRYILSWDEISSVIPGLRKVKNVESAVSYSEKGKLSGDLMEELKEHSWERNFYNKEENDPSMEKDQYVEK